jgi:hypothetical protein
LGLLMLLMKQTDGWKTINNELYIL